jgi:glucose/arabinose dehydrogenase
MPTNGFLMRLWVLALGIGAFAQVSFSALPSNITYKDFFEGKATFVKPLYFAEVPGKPNHYVVLEQHTGNVIVAAVSGETVTKSTMVTVKVGTANEIGLLGFAFHPKFTENRKYYLSYNPTNDSSVIEERVADASLIKDGGTAAKVLMRFKQPYSNHNGGSIAFSPRDNYLYLGFGDGGSSNDPQGRSRMKDSVFAKILRIDVDKAENGKNYGIPSDNPFVGQSPWLPETWAWGLRNPWKFSFDPITNKLWVGDVGQGAREEIDTVPKGGDMGWKLTEGKQCLSGTTCDRTGQTPPVLEYPREIGNSVTGGVVFRGNPASPFYGAYFYGDYGSRRIFVITLNASQTAIADSAALPSLTELPTSFGTDLKGNIFLVGHNTQSSQPGRIWLLDSPDLRPSSTPIQQLRKEKAIRCCFNQVGKTWVVRNTGEARMESVHFTDLDGRSLKRATTGELQQGIEFTSTPGVYLAHATTPEGSYTLRLIVH